MRPLILWYYNVTNDRHCFDLSDELLGEKEKYKGISEELDATFSELAGF